MAIIVEDGSIVANANSYVSEAELTAFALARGITLTAAADVLLMKAMDYIETLNYKGHRKSSTQALKFPRYGILVDGYCLPSDEIPQQLKNGLMQLAIAIDEGYNPLTTTTQGVKRETVDVISIEYMDGSSSTPLVKSMIATLAPLLGGGTGRNVVRVNKA